MDERLHKLEEAIARCEAAALRLARREARLREAAREAIADIDRLLKASPHG